MKKNPILHVLILLVCLALVSMSCSSPTSNPPQTPSQWVHTSTPGRVNAMTVIGTTIFAATSNGVYRWVENGISWIGVNTGSDLDCLAVIDTTLYAASLYGMERSSDFGSHWVFSLIDDGSTRSNAVTALVTTQRQLYVGTETGVFHSTDAGKTWKLMNPGLEGTKVLDFGSNGSSIFAGTDHGLFRTTNDGTTWTAVNTGLQSQFVECMTVVGTSLFAGLGSTTGTGAGIYRSMNNGDSWSSVNSGLPSGDQVWSFQAHGTDLFAGTDKGVYLSTNNGDSWSLYNGLLDDAVLALAIKDTTLYAGGYVSGFWQTPVKK